MKRLTVSILCILLLIPVVYFSYAAYVSKTYVKGVATTPVRGLPLSSDYLVVVSKSDSINSYPVKKILFEEKAETDESPYSFSFYIENSSEGLVSDRKMAYLLKIDNLPESASVFFGNKNEDISSSVKTGYPSPAMPVYQIEKHHYTISIPKDSIKNLNDIIITAIPVSDSDSNGNMLAAKIQLSVAGAVAGFGYNGSFLDKSASNHPYDYAAFNYEITVTNATEEHVMILEWDDSCVELDPLFIIENNDIVTAVQGSNNEVEIKMNSGNNDYLVKFFRIKGQNNTEEWQNSWENMNNVIKFYEKNMTVE